MGVVVSAFLLLLLAGGLFLGNILLLLRTRRMELARLERSKLEHAEVMRLLGLYSAQLVRLQARERLQKSRTGASLPLLSDTERVERPVERAESPRGAPEARKEREEPRWESWSDVLAAAARERGEKEPE